MNRRKFLKVLGVGGVGAAAAAIGSKEVAASVPEPAVDTPSSRLQTYELNIDAPHSFGTHVPLMGSCGFGGTVPWSFTTEWRVNNDR